MEVFERLESNVRGYCRAFPTVFTHARGARLHDQEGRSYIDFFAGAGALNYGHNHPRLKQALIDYLQRDGVVHSLDMATAAKRALLETFDSVILQPRGMRYRMQFPGPTGTNAVEAALKVARKATGRSNVVSFTNAFHGMTLGSLALTGNGDKRAGAGVPLSHATVMPFDGYLGPDTDSLDYFAALLSDRGSGIDVPAAVIIETVQAEGGINVASKRWLQRLRALTQEHGIALIIDDIQVGCGRTGPFFSFERAGITPDIVCLSKSLSGYGLPLAMVLISPAFDVWEPGEHNGTFRGHNPAFVTATAALELWRDNQLPARVERLGATIEHAFNTLITRYPTHLSQRGLGMIRGLACPPHIAERASRHAFERGLIVETAGPRSEVLKVLPPLLISDDDLSAGLDILCHSVVRALEGDASVRPTSRPAPAQIAGASR